VNLCLSYNVTKTLSAAFVLRTRRRALDLTQGELAALAGVSRQTISSVERACTATPDKLTIDALADALGLRPEEVAALFTEAER
jgi:transcriptional regulator with XRE-family HTH domain